MQDIPLLRSREFDCVTSAERRLIASAVEQPVAFAKGEVIQAQGIAPESVHILVSGWAGSAMLLANGRQQIVRLHLPGDMLGLPSVALRATAECITALTAATVASLPLRTFLQLATSIPNLNLMLLLWGQREQIALMDALTSVGRTSAKSRVAAFLLDIAERVAEAGLGDGWSFPLPLTQDQFANLAGLSTVHVNRSISQLRDAKLITWKSHHVRILNRDELQDVAMRNERSDIDAPAWLAKLLSSRPG